MKKAEEKLFQARKLVAKVGALMLRRNLTDLAGGNISMRIGKKVLMSPTLAGTYKFWNIKPEEVLVMDLEGHKLDGNVKSHANLQHIYFFLINFICTEKR